MNKNSLLILGLLFGSANSVAEPGDAQVADRFCATRTVGEQQASEVCHLPVVRLLAAPEKYEGKLIRVTGFLVKHNDVYALFPSREAFVGSAGEAGIPLLGEGIPEDIREAALTESGASGVTVIGRFDYGPYPSIQGSPGTIREVVAMYFAAFLRDFREEA